MKLSICFFDRFMTQCQDEVRSSSILSSGELKRHAFNNQFHELKRIAGHPHMVEMPCYLFQAMKSIIEGVSAASAYQQHQRISSSNASALQQHSGISTISASAASVHQLHASEGISAHIHQLRSYQPIYNNTTRHAPDTTRHAPDTTRHAPDTTRYHQICIIYWHQCLNLYILE